MRQIIRERKIKQRLLVLGILLGAGGLLLVLTARHSPEQVSTLAILPTQELLFEGIAQDELSIGLGYRGIVTPTLLIIARPEDIDALGPAVHLPELPSKLTSQLRAIDYNRFFAIWVVLGPSESKQYKVLIQQIARQDSRVVVKAEFSEPVRRIGAIVPALPYHLVKVSKENNWAEQIQFVLIKGEAQIAETAHFIPQYKNNSQQEKERNHEKAYHFLLIGFYSTGSYNLFKSRFRCFG